MSRLAMAGVSHRRASLPLLERLAVRGPQVGELLTMLCRLGCAEAFVLSTCSRTELYAVVDDTADGGVLVNALAAFSGLQSATLKLVADERRGDSVVSHLFRVTAGLDARILGESDIQRQVTEAANLATKAGAVGPVLTRLLSRAAGVGRKVRRDTGLGETARSMGVAAADAALSAVAGRPGATVAIVGSGRMATVVADRLRGRDVDVVVFARSVQQARRLSGQTRAVEKLADELAALDAVVCATSAIDYVIRGDDVADAMALRPDRPLTVIDLSVPRNVDDAVRDVAGVRLVDVEGLLDGDQHMVREAALAGEVLVGEETRRFLDDQRAQPAGPVIAQLRSHLEELCATELSRALRGYVDAETLARAAHAVAGKVLHEPTLAARRAASAGDVDKLRELSTLFGVRPDDQSLSAEVASMADAEVGAEPDAEVGAGPGADRGVVAAAEHAVVHRERRQTVQGRPLAGHGERRRAGRVATHRPLPGRFASASSASASSTSRPSDGNRRANRAAHVEVDAEAWRSFKQHVKGAATMADAVGSLIEQEAARLAMADDLSADLRPDGPGRRGRPGAGRRARQFAWLVVSDESWGLLHLSAVVNGVTVARAIGELVEKAVQEQAVQEQAVSTGA
jgi:glutamyl-tRNA reductase